MDNENLLGKRIRELRENANLTQFQLAEKVNVDGKYISRIELGRNLPNYKLLHRFSEVFGIEMKDLFDFEHHKDVEKIKEEIPQMLESFNEDEIRKVYRYLKNMKW